MFYKTTTNCEQKKPGIPAYGWLCLLNSFSVQFSHSPAAGSKPKLAAVSVQTTVLLTIANPLCLIGFEKLTSRF